MPTTTADSAADLCKSGSPTSVDASIARFLATRPAFTDQMRDRISVALTPRIDAADARPARAA
ncbi:hypothetical protein [Brachybacterium hainanense]|uniref:Uncharacterized protein n=1 Tax=Brachybacterium hainanense TaxID=1541174 RepID=A0ABV6RC57_9MICO